MAGRGRACGELSRGLVLRSPQLIVRQENGCSGIEFALHDQLGAPTRESAGAAVVEGDAGELLGQLAAARPELGEHGAMRFAAAVMVTGAVWTHAQPSAAMLAAYDADPELAAMRLDFAASLLEVLAVLVAGLLARGSS